MPEQEIIPERIISLTPSLTEILFALGLGSRVSGVTDSCDFPAEVKHRPNVACWFDPDLAKLFTLKSDMILGLQTAQYKLKHQIKWYGDVHKIISFYQGTAMIEEKHALESPHRCSWCPAPYNRSERLKKKEGSRLHS